MEMRSHYGHVVTVVLDREQPRARALGRLIEIDDEGQATVDCGHLPEGGCRHYCWPALAVQCHDCSTVAPS